MIKEVDVLVVGGGVIGLCAAYYLSCQGRSVTVLDRGDASAGCSYGNAGLIVPSHSVPLAMPGVASKAMKWLIDPESPFYIKPRPDVELVEWLLRFRAASTTEAMHRGIPVMLALNHASILLFEELAAQDELDFGYEQRGGLYLFTTPEGFQGGVAEAERLRRYGVPAVVLGAEGVRDLVPSAALSVIGGVFYPEDAHIIPHQFLRGLTELLEKQGVCIQTQHEVLAMETKGRRVCSLITTRGDYQPHTVVLAAGAWSPALSRDVGLRLPVQPAKGYSITVKRPSNCPEIPLHLGERKVAVTPMGDTLRFAGTLELAGYDLSISRQRVSAIRRAADEYLQMDGEIEHVETWRGLRPLTPDTLPIIGRSPRQHNLIVATGHGMQGISMGPITGKLVAELAARRPTSIDLTALALRRF